MSDDAERVWDVLERISICMLASWDGTELRSRPMAAFVRRRNSAIYFLADTRHYTHIRAYPKVCLAFADPAGERFVSLTGLAEVSADRAVIRELWSTPAQAFWDSAEDPNIRMLRITPLHAELWDGLGRTVRAVSLTIPVPGRTGGGAKTSS